jgi:hypothetical protein
MEWPPYNGTKRYSIFQNASSFFLISNRYSSNNCQISWGKKLNKNIDRALC